MHVSNLVAEAAYMRILLRVYAQWPQVVGGPDCDHSVVCRLPGMSGLHTQSTMTAFESKHAMPARYSVLDRYP